MGDCAGRRHRSTDLLYSWEVRWTTGPVREEGGTSSHPEEAPGRRVCFVLVDEGGASSHPEEAPGRHVCCVLEVVLVVVLLLP